MFRLLTAVLFLASFVVSIFYFIATALGRLVFNPDSKAWKDLLNNLRARLNKKNIEPLTPFNSDLLALLSLKPKVTKKPGWLDSSFEGTLSTIYQEPLLFFAGQRNGRTAVIVARSSKNEYIFRQKETETEIWLDSQPFAVLVDGTLLSAGKKSKMLAKLETNPDLRQWPLLIGDGEAATIANPDRTISPIPRALTLLRDLTPEEEPAVLALAILKSLKS